MNRKFIPVLFYFLYRKQKRVVVNGKTLVPYDHLILTTGTQYTVPAPTEADISKLLTNFEVPNSPDRRFTGSTPKNCFVINDSYDAAVALHWSELNILNTTGILPVQSNQHHIIILTLSQTCFLKDPQGSQMSYLDFTSKITKDVQWICVGL